MAAGNAELEMRVKALETRVARHEDDITSLIDTVNLIHEDTTWLKRGMTMLLER